MTVHVGIRVSAAVLSHPGYVRLRDAIFVNRRAERGWRYCRRFQPRVVSERKYTTNELRQTIVSDAKTSANTQVSGYACRWHCPKIGVTKTIPLGRQLLLVENTNRPISILIIRPQNVG